MVRVDLHNRSPGRRQRDASSLAGYLMLEAASARLLIRRPQPADLDALRAYRNHPDVVAQLGGEMSAEWIRSMIETQSALVPGGNGGRVTRMVEHRALNRVIGEVNAFLIPARCHAEIGWIIHPEYQRNGFATEAACLLVRSLFELGMHRLTAACLQENIASWRVMERLGMRREGALRQSRQIGKGWRDEFIYAMLIEDEVRIDLS